MSMPDEAQPSPPASHTTSELAFAEARSLKSTMFSWADAQDTKAATILTVGTILIGVAPAIGSDAGTWWAALLWIPAGVAWLGTAWFSLRAFRIGEYVVGPDPRVLLEEGWLSLTRAYYAQYRLEELADEVDRMKGELDRKSRALGRAMGWLVVQSLLLLVGVIVTRVI